MKCIRCGLTKSGPYSSKYVCDDCLDFSPILIDIWNDIDQKMKTVEAIEPSTHPIFQLLADSTFVTAMNPQTRIFHKVCESLLAEAVKGNHEMTDSQLARSVRTTRGFSDVFRVFTDLGLIKIRNEKYQRVLVFQEKLEKMAQQYHIGTKVSDELTERHAHIYAGYVLLYILSLVARMKDSDDVAELPYGKRPQALWVILMFLWKSAYNRNDEFTSEEMRKFLARRGIPTSVVDTITRRLQGVDSKTTQALIKDSVFIDGQIKFRFEDYVMKEFERIRELERDRRRSS